MELIGFVSCQFGIRDFEKERYIFLVIKGRRVEN